METFYLILLIPVIIALVARWKFHHTITWPEVAAQTLAVIVVVTTVWFTGIYGKMSDTELWNGQVTEKKRDHGHYLRSYQCNCTTDSNGNTSCQTCYEDRYTVDWYLN